MGPFVDVVADSVAPVLEEFRRRASVIDLVEVHLVRLGQAEHPDPEDRHDENGEQPQVKPVEPPAGLVMEAAGAVGPDGPLRELGPEPAPRPELHEGRRAGPGQRGELRSRRHAEGRWSRRSQWCRSDSRGRLGPTDRERRPARRRPGVECLVGEIVFEHRVIDGAIDEVSAEAPFCRRSELDERPQGRHERREGDDRDPALAADRRADPEPVADPRVVRVERRQDHVHVEEHGQRQDDIGRPPAPRERGQDRPDGDEREQVSLVDARRQHEERDREDHETREHRQPVGSPGHNDTDGGEGDQHEQGPDDDRRHRADHHRLGARWVAGRGVEDHRVAGPATGRRHPRPVRRGECPWVVGVDAGVWVLAGRLQHLLEETRGERRSVRAGRDHGQAEREAQDDCGEEAGDPRRQDPQGSVGPLLPCGEARPQPSNSRARPERRRPVSVVDRRVQVAPAVAARRPQRPADRHDGDDRGQDRQLRLDQGGDHGQDRRSLRLVTPQGPQPEKQEDHPERIDLAPHDRIEPGDRVGDDQRRAEESGPPTGADLASHRPHEPAERNVGEDRRDLDQVADIAEELPDDADRIEDIEVAGRVIVEEGPLVEAAEALICEVGRPGVEGGQIDLEAGSRVDVCDDEPEGEPEREDDQDRAGVIPRPGCPRRRVRVPARSARNAAGRQGMDLPERALRWTAG